MIKSLKILDNKWELLRAKIKKLSGRMTAFGFDPITHLFGPDNIVYVEIPTINLDGWDFIKYYQTDIENNEEQEVACSLCPRRGVFVLRNEIGEISGSCLNCLDEFFNDQDTSEVVDLIRAIAEFHKINYVSDEIPKKPKPKGIRIKQPDLDRRKKEKYKSDRKKRNQRGQLKRENPNT